ncbi:MAG: Hpt domain-containing protein [Planctomycetota bacterium]
MHTNPELRIFNREELLERCLNEHQIADKVLDVFLTGFESDIEQLEKLIQEHSFEAAGRIAHRMKGSAGNTAAHRLYEVAAQLQHAADMSDVEAHSLLLDLKECWTEFKSVASDS